MLPLCFLLDLHDNGSNTCLCWFFRTTEWQWLMLTLDHWRRELEILNFRTDNKNLGFMQVRKETLWVAPLGVGLGDLPVGRPEVWMMLDLYSNFPTKTTKVFLRQFVLTSIVSFLSLDCLWSCWNLDETSLEFTWWSFVVNN